MFAVPAHLDSDVFRPRSWPVYWPIAALLLAFPVWWLLGVARFMPILIALIMIRQLARRPVVVLPRGFGWWLLFITWVCLGVFVLTADAPGAVPGGGGFGRALVWAFNLSIYLSATVALVWVANLSEEELPFDRLARIVGWLFVFSTIGGLMGLLLPAFDFKSLLELLLPDRLTSNSFVRSLIHPGLSDVQYVLGRPESRPKAPFPYANTWGSVMALSLPFFVIGWWRYGSWRHKVVVPVTVMLSAIPIVYSLNRGLWVCLGAGVIFVIVYHVKKGHWLPLVGAMLALVLGVAVFAVSPLSTIAGERLENQHSNDRRGRLLAETVQSSATGSPVIGFGATRDVQGSFASIAGGATPDCPACAVPPLGTQGHIWMVIFTQGFVGAVFFLMFFLSAFWWSSGMRTLSQAVALCLVLFLFLQMGIYDTGGMPLLVVMLAIGAAWRDLRAQEPTRRMDSVASLLHEVWNWRLVICGLAALGMLFGAGVAAAAKPEYGASVYVRLNSLPSHLQAGSEEAEPRQTTIDTEAALVVSRQTLERVATDPDVQAELRDGLEITAVPTTQVLVITLRSHDSETVAHQAELIASSYLDTRRLHLQDRRSQMLSELYDQLAAVVGLGVSATNAERSNLEDGIFTILLTPTTAGEQVRTEGPWRESMEYGKQIGSGLALGFLAAIILMAMRLPRIER